MSETSRRDACPACDTPCAWTPERAGRRMRCACGQIFRMPTTQGGRVAAGEPQPPPTPAQPAPTPAPAPEPDVYEVDLPDDLAGPPAPPAAAQAPLAHGTSSGKCPSCNGPLRPGAIICMNCGFNLAQGSKIQTRIETDP